MASTSLFKKILIKATAVGFSSTALALAFNPSAFAVNKTCVETPGLDIVGIESCENPTGPGITTIPTPMGGLDPSPLPPGVGGDELTIDGDIDSLADMDGFEFMLNSFADVVTFQFASGNIEPDGSISYDFSGPGGVIDAGIIGPPLPDDTGESIFSGSYVPGIYTLNVTSITALVGTGYEAEIAFFRRTEHVPGPLPIMGAGVAFGFSRNLRRRVSAARKA